MDSGMESVVEVVTALVEAEAVLAEYAQRLRLRPDVSEVTTSMKFRAGPSIDLFADAELESGEALSWGLLANFDGTEWHIESDIRRNHEKGQDLVRQLPERFAVTPSELAAEIRSAAAMLVRDPLAEPELFSGEGYGP